MTQNNQEDFKQYPNMDAWIRDRQFCDSDELYTNGAELITVNNVLKGWNYYMNLAEQRARADAIDELKELRELIKAYENAPSDAYWYEKGREDVIDELFKFCFGLKASQGNMCRVDVIERKLKIMKEESKKNE